MENGWRKEAEGRVKCVLDENGIEKIEEYKEWKVKKINRGFVEGPDIGGLIFYSLLVDSEQKDWDNVNFASG